MKHYLLVLATIGLLFTGAAGCGDDGGDPAPTPDAAVETPDAALETPDAAAETFDASTALLGLFETCTANTECESDLCHTYGDGSMLCSQMCAVDADCPAPSTACNAMGVCQRPQQ